MLVAASYIGAAIKVAIYLIRRAYAAHPRLVVFAFVALIGGSAVYGSLFGLGKHRGVLQGDAVATPAPSCIYSVGGTCTLPADRYVWAQGPGSTCLDMSGPRVTVVDPFLCPR
jgi:hypothetical protein